jgi:4-aminobutyrate aminotransferase-like enzyme
LLERGYLVLPAGAEADVIQLSPAVTVTDEQLAGFIEALGDSLEAS